MNVIALIPAYNEEATIADVLARTRSFVDGVIVVDDGSEDRTSQIARAQGAMVVRHVLNRGLGASLATGFEAALRLGADVVVTLDADGQHDPVEVAKFVAAIQSGADVVIGSRRLTGFVGMPLNRRVAQIAGNLATFLLFGARVTDSQSGFRALTRWALGQIALKSGRMEVSSEIIAESKRHGLKLVEVPIRSIYTPYSLAKGQSFLVGLKTLFKLVVRRMTR